MFALGAGITETCYQMYKHQSTGLSPESLFYMWIGNLNLGVFYFIWFPLHSLTNPAFLSRQLSQNERNNNEHGINKEEHFELLFTIRNLYDFILLPSSSNIHPIDCEGS